MLILDAFKVFRQGEALADAETWRSRAALTKTLASIFTGIAGIAYAKGWIHVSLSADDLQSIALGLATLYGVVDSLLHVATSPTAGLPPKPAGVPTTDAEADAVLQAVHHPAPSQATPPIFRDDIN